MLRPAETPLLSAQAARPGRPVPSASRMSFASRMPLASAAPTGASAASASTACASVPSGLGSGSALDTDVSRETSVSLCASAFASPRAPERFVHGGDIYTHPAVLDFSANINPLGMPPAAAKALVEAASEASVYPDPQCRELVSALSDHMQVPASRILCTAGASDAIMRLCHAVRPTCALVTAPCFAGYERALAAAGARVRRHELRDSEGFALTPRVLDDIAPDVDLVMLCTPNNPTGLLADFSLVHRVLDRARQTGAIVMLDESFLGFVDPVEAPSARTLLEAYPNLVVVDAFTKLYAMAGVRLGFALCSDAELLARIELAGPEWAVSTSAQRAGAAALQDGSFVPRTRALVSSAREHLANDLRDLGFRVLDGQANFLLFQSPVPLFEPMLERGVLVRPCESYQGLDASWFRVAVRLPQENARLVSALQACLRVSHPASSASASAVDPVAPSFSAVLAAPGEPSAPAAPAKTSADAAALAAPDDLPVPAARVAPAACTASDMRDVQPVPDAFTEANR